MKWSESHSVMSDFLQPHGLQARMEWVAYPFSSRSSWPRDLGSPALQMDSLPTELSGKPPKWRTCNSPGQNTGVGSLSLLQGIFPTQGSNQVSHIAGRFFTSWATREAHVDLNRIYFKILFVSQRRPSGLSGQESTRQGRRLGFDPWVQKIPWRRKWQPTPVFLPGKSYGQRGLAGYSPWGHKEPDTTERLNNNNSFSHSSFTLWHRNQNHFQCSFVGWLVDF